MTFRRLLDKIFAWMAVALVALVCFFGMMVNDQVAQVDESQQDTKERVRVLEESKKEFNRRLDRIEYKQDSMESKVDRILEEVRKK